MRIRDAVRTFASAALALACAAAAAVASAAAPPRIWGVTLDDTADASPARLAAEATALSRLPERPLSRIVVDVGTTPGDYARALSRLGRVSDLMVELGDSSEVRHVAVPAYARFVSSFVHAYGRQVSLWEIGNEVNGEWVGSPAAEDARIAAAFETVEAAGGRTALTLYFNLDCWTRRGNEMFRWLAAGNVAPAIRRKLDFVFISFYPGDCNDHWPSPGAWQDAFDRLHALFPRARLGFGESGTAKPTDLSPVGQVALLDRYAAVSIRGDSYVGGFFWWNWAENAVPAGGVFWNGYAAAMRASP